MKKILPILLTLLLLAGCRIDTDIRPDTIVDIPLKPTESVTETGTEEEETAADTVPPTQPPTQPPTEKPTSESKDDSAQSAAKKPSTKKPSNKKEQSSTKDTEPAKPTEPPTEPPTQPPTQPSVSAYSPTKLDKAIIKAINAQRIDAGLPELSTSKKLFTAAARRAAELPRSWSHTRPDGSDFSTVLAEFGIRASHCAENLYYAATPKADELVARWMDSPQHRSQILSEDAATIGVAACTADGITYIAALFIG